jgi:hypothetical protein
MTSPTLAPVFEHIEARHDDYVERLIDYVRNPSISAHNIGIREVSELLVKMLGELGMEVEAIPTKGHPFVLARYTVDPARPTVLLYGHYDVQPPDPLELWESPPFEPTIRNGRIYARGVGDNKGQHFAQIMAIEAHLKVHGTLPCNVIFLLEGEEEIGSPQIADFVRDHKDRLKADFVVTADGPLHESGNSTLTYGVRGMTSFELRVRTAARDAHSGNYGGVMPNAIWTLVHLLSTMKTPDGRITIEGLHDQIVLPTEADISATRALPLDLPQYMAEMGLQRLDAPADRPFWDRLMFHPTLTINGSAWWLWRARHQVGAALRGGRQVRHPPRRSHDARARLCLRPGPCGQACARGGGDHLWLYAALAHAAGRSLGQVDPGSHRRGAERTAPGLPLGRGQPSRLCLHQGAGRSRLRHALCQCRRGQPRPEREHGNRAVPQGHPHRLGAPVGTRQAARIGRVDRRYPNADTRSFV